MRISKGVIELVLSGGGTEEEKEQVRSFFRENPAELSRYMTEESWDAFHPDPTWDAPKEKMIASIEEEIGAMPAPILSIKGRMKRSMWVAAAAVMLLAAPLLVLLKNKKTTDKRPEIMVSSSEPKKEVRWQTIANGSLHSKLYTLPDGSKVKLASNSRIRFTSPYIDHRRDIYLEGEGTFTVAPDKTRPFAVHSENLTTTALGTVFRVRNGLVTSVQLFSGRVVVDGKSVDHVYLQPGQELRLNNSSLAVELRLEAPKVTLPRVVKPQPIVLNFVKKPLTEIFNQLQEQYKVSISYEHVNLQNADFTGVFDSSKENLESFLTALCDLNGLKLVGSQDKGYMIQTN